MTTVTHNASNDIMRLYVNIIVRKFARRYGEDATIIVTFHDDEITVWIDGDFYTAVLAIDHALTFNSDTNSPISVPQLNGSSADRKAVMKSVKQMRDGTHPVPEHIDNISRKGTPARKKWTQIPKRRSVEDRIIDEQIKYINARFGGAAADKANYGWFVDGDRDGCVIVETKIYGHGVLITNGNSEGFHHTFRPF